MSEDPNHADPQKSAGSAAEEKRYTEAYVTRLRNEAAELRTQADALAKERDELKAFRAEIERKDAEAKGDYEKAKAKYEADLAAERKAREADNAARDARYVLSEARTAVSKLGIIEGLEAKVGALADLKDLKIEPDGSIPGLQERLEKLKAENPTWFKTENASQPRAGASPGGAQNGSGKGLDWATVPDDQLDARIQELLHP
jgi:predicted RNase H-like nuclease (RuvC/YqgF family)